MSLFLRVRCVAALFAFISFLMILGITPAEAQTSRLYLSGYLGLSDFGANDFDDSSVPTSGELDVDETQAFAGALGLRLSKNLRVEAELSYKNTDINTATFSGIGKVDASGEIESYTGLLSAYYDFDFGWEKLQPFVGAGLGFGWHDSNITDTSGFSSTSAGDAYNVAWQLGAGLKYRMKPGLALTGGYRYIDGTDLEFGSYEIDYGGHEIRFGLEYDLNFQ